MNIFKIKFKEIAGEPKTLKELFGPDKLEIWVRQDDWHIKCYFRVTRLNPRVSRVCLNQYSRDGIRIKMSEIRLQEDKPQWHIYNKGDEDKYDE